MPVSTRKARLLLKQKKAKIVCYSPFTIQLLYATGETKQEITLGVDAGSKTIGLSAVSDKQELFSAEVKLRTDIIDLLSTRREYRRTRRSRLRYRKPRSLNRARSKGWLAPSIKNKIEAHLKAIKLVCELLPVTKIIAEATSFDIQKIKNPKI
jgi:N6-L-threonylcarbamoyladenine synthase